VKDASVVIVTVGGSLWTGAERCKCFFHQLISSKQILCFLRYLCHKHIKILCDNATAVAYLNNFGGTKSMKCNSKARDIWELAVSNRIWITAVHLPGVENLTADRESRKIRDETEWSLNDSLFNKIQSLRVDLDIDLFASRLNYKISKFVSWKADPLAWAIDAFTLQWKNFIFYAFPPFSLIDRVCKKFLVRRSRGNFSRPLLASAELVPISFETLCQSTLDNKTRKTYINSSEQTRDSSSVTQESTSASLSCVRTSLQQRNLSERTIQVIMNSWRNSTCKSYSSYLRKWEAFAFQYNFNVWNPDISDVLEFFTFLIDQGCGYSVINTARSALSTIINVDNLPIGKHSLVKRFVSGVYNIKPSLPRYTAT
jgi:hypothetical protein